MDDVVRWRRHLHRHPELSFEERETADFVAATLDGFGLEVTRPSENAVVARPTCSTWSRGGSTRWRPPSVSVGSFHAGEAANVIPGRVELSGTVRSFDAGVRARLRELVDEVARGVSATHGAECELDCLLGYDPVVNDERATALVRAAAGEDALAPLAPIMGGDDFSAYLAQVPGCYAFIGAGSEAAGAVHPHHHPRFRIDERALAVGVRLHVDVARRALDEVR
jgi:metal-dependent amidase/aminoacylase/carboxypeptidase family protein